VPVTEARRRRWVEAWRRGRWADATGSHGRRDPQRDGGQPR
jgi:hypothetical protein